MFARMIFFYSLPLAVIWFYQLVPAPVRGRYPYFGRLPSTSVRCAAAIRAGGPAWRNIWFAVTDQGGYHPDR